MFSMESGNRGTKNDNFTITMSLYGIEQLRVPESKISSFSFMTFCWFELSEMGCQIL